MSCSTKYYPGIVKARGMCVIKVERRQTEEKDPNKSENGRR